MENAVYLGAVPNDRFLTLRVDWRVSIREFIEEECCGLRLRFEPGRGFYQWTRRELIRENTKVVLRDKKTGELFSGKGARRMIGLWPGERARLKPVKLEKYDIFLQSQSLNRKLVGGTQLLYQIKKEEP